MLECVNQNVLIYIFVDRVRSGYQHCVAICGVPFFNIVLFFACCYIKKLAYLHLDPDLSLTVISLTGP